MKGHIVNHRPGVLGRPGARSVLCALGIVLIFLGSGKVWAQNAAGRESSSRHPLAVREQIVRDRVRQMEDRMVRLVDQLRASEPAQARRLERAIRSLSELRVQRNLEQIVGLLDDEARWDQALQEQEKLLNDLESLLAVLTVEESETPSDAALADLQEVLNRLNDLLDRERKLTEDTRLVADAQQMESLAGIQKEILELTKQLLEHMRQGEGGDPQSPTPGAEQVSDAGDLMSLAAEQLERGDNESAETQQEAADRLEQARQQLQRRMQQLRALRRRRAMLDLKSKFEELLRRQQEAGEATQRLGEKEPALWSRMDELEAMDWGRREDQMGETTEQARTLLADAGADEEFVQNVAELREGFRSASERLGGLDAGEETQRIQSSILSRLKEILSALEQEEQAAAGSAPVGTPGTGSKPIVAAGPRSSSPATKSTTPAGSGAEGALAPAPGVQPGEMWGQMPPAQREEILQHLGESFPESYRALIEQYYEELSKEK